MQPPMNSDFTSQEEPMRVTSVRLPDWHIRRAKKIGDTSFSDGVRKAIEAYGMNQKEQTQ